MPKSEAGVFHPLSFEEAIKSIVNVDPDGLALLLRPQANAPI